jgi:hypothetical protein
MNRSLAAHDFRLGGDERLPLGDCWPYITIHYDFLFIQFFSGIFIQH